MSLLSGGKYSGWPTTAPLLAGIVFTFLASVWAPWQVVHPIDASLRQPLSYAPLWSHRYGNLPGAGINWTGFAVNVGVIWVVCIAAIIMLNMSTQHD